jgi:hypothetical protein
MSDEAGVLYKILLAHTFLAGVAGFFGRLYIGGYLLSTESTRSPSPLRRFGYRYLVFGLYYLVSFLFSPVLMAPFADAMREASLGANVKPLIYFAACLPMATGLYFLDCWIIVRSDPLKAAIRTGRTRFR